MATELEGRLGVNAGASLPAQKVEKSPAAAPVLTAGALELTAEERERQAKEFGQDGDDYYPTERHAHPKTDAKPEHNNQ